MKMQLGKEVGLGPGHIVLDGDPVGTQPSPYPFRPMPIVAKRSPISATAELLLWSPYGIEQTIIFLPCCFFFYLSFFPRLISVVADYMSAILSHMVWP